MDILALCRKMVILFFCMATGFAAAKGGAMDLQSNKKLSALVVNIANPMQILASALTGEHLLSNGETLRLAGLIVLIYLGLIALSFPAAKVLRVKGSEAGLYRFMFIFSNTGFLGYPIVESLLGYQATFYVTLFVLFFQLFCWSYGASLIRGEARFRFQWQVLRQPCVAASLAALAIYLSGWQPPALLHQAVKYVGDITSPIVMLIVGCSLAQMRPGQIFGNWRVYALSFLKMAAVPLLAFVILRQVLSSEFVLCVLTVLLHRAVKYVGDITSPIVMLIVGCSLAQMRFGQIFGSWRIYALTILKMVLVPLAAFFVLRHVLTNDFTFHVLMVILCMPVATNTTILSYQYGADESVASAGVFVSTLACMLTIPLMMQLLFG